MSRERFEELVRRLEAAAERSPRGYKARVALLAALGFAWIFAILAVVLALGWGIVAFMVANGRFNILVGKLLVVLGVLAFAILRSLWVRFDAPEGLPITRRDAPRLFDMIADLRRPLKAPPFHCVLVTREFNAAVVQVPRLGIFGWQRNYLLIGLPLLQAFSVDHVRAVVAHEMGHLAGAHSRFSGWIYRLDRSWDQLLERLHQEHTWGRAVFTWFFERYSPFFSAYTFALRRANEYEADRFSASLVGVRTAAEALSALPGAAVAHDRYWEEVRRSVAIRDTPPESLFAPIREAFAAPDARAKWPDALAQALREETGTVDTHPALADRLKALGHEPVLPEPPATTAAETLFGVSLGRISAALDAAWRDEMAPIWERLHGELRDKSDRRDALRAREAAGEALSCRETWMLAGFTEELEGPDAALPLYRRAVEIDAAFAPGQFDLGRLLLDRDDPAGVPHLERAMQMDEEARQVVLERLYAWHRGRKDEDAARRISVLLDAHDDVLKEAYAERNALSVNDRFVPHELDASGVESLRAQLVERPEIAQAFLVRKDVRRLPGRPLYLLVVVRRRRWWKPESSEAGARLQQLLAQSLELPGECFVVCAEGSGRPFLGAVRRIPGSEILLSSRSARAA